MTRTTTYPDGTIVETNATPDEFAEYDRCLMKKMIEQMKANEEGTAEPCPPQYPERN